MPASRTHQNGAAQFNQKLKNLFRINLNSGADRDREKSSAAHLQSSTDASPARPEARSKFGSSFFKGTVGRLRTNTTASEGNPLDEALSPTAHANPYFVHQGQPGLRHHNNESVPPSPPDTPNFKIQGPDGGPEQQTTSAGREELARKLRRVASAPNAQGLFSKGKGSAERSAGARQGLRHPRDG
ncbi:serine/threonine-protein kinase nrc-2 [Colletotrichum higginsianum]|nr:serine/threonine-protein kinase nrc-2 [Colletotrichum higginsianum]